MGGAASGAKGAQRERELVNYFADAGWGALRLPSSGSATDRELPDVLAGRPREATPKAGWTHPKPVKTYTQSFAIEAKSGKATTLYVDASEVEDLRAFADRWGATPYLAARSTQQATDTCHYLVAPEDARMTPSGRFGLPIDDIEERASVRVGGDGVAFVDGGGV